MILHIRPIFQIYLRIKIDINGKKLYFSTNNPRSRNCINLYLNKPLVPAPSPYYVIFSRHACSICLQILLPWAQLINFD